MKYTSHFLLLVLCGCNSTSAYTIRSDKDLIGVSVQETIAELGITMKPDFLIDEPPCVARGIRGIAYNGDTIELYIRRGAIPFDANRSYKLANFLALPIIGIARQHDSKWHITGQTIRL